MMPGETRIDPCTAAIGAFVSGEDVSAPRAAAT